MLYILVNNLPAIWGIWVPFLGGKDPLEEGNPLQYSCPENPTGKGDWWTTVRGVAESDRLNDGQFSGQENYYKSILRKLPTLPHYSSSYSLAPSPVSLASVHTQLILVDIYSVFPWSSLRRVIHIAFP